MTALPVAGPFGLPSDTDPSDFYQAEWIGLFGGAIGSGRLGAGWALTPGGSDTTVTVGPGTAVVQGIYCESTDPIVLNVATATGAITPSSGQTRWDLIVITVDAPAKTAVLEVIPGTPVSSSGAIRPPTLTRVLGGIWQEPIASVIRTGNVAVTTPTLRPYNNFIAGVRLLDAAQELPTDLPIGTVAVRGLNMHVKHDEDTWRSVLDPEWNALSIGNPLSIGPAWRRVGGMLQLRGFWRRTTGTYPTSGYYTVGSLPAAAVDGIPSGTYRYPIVGYSTVEVPTWLAIGVTAPLGASISVWAQGPSVRDIHLGVIQLPYAEA